MEGDEEEDLWKGDEEEDLWEGMRRKTCGGG